MTRRVRASIGAALVVVIFIGCYEDTATALRDAPVYRAYAADRVYHCPVPFFYETAGITHVWEGADLVMRFGGRVELTYYSRFGSGDDPINWQADTLRVLGTYSRDGFIVRFTFDEGFTRAVPMEGELLEDGRMLAATADGSQLEFVPLDQRPGGEPEHCEA